MLADLELEGHVVDTIAQTPRVLSPLGFAGLSPTYGYATLRLRRRLRLQFALSAALTDLVERYHGT
jgi:hypothetical protein